MLEECEGRGLRKPEFADIDGMLRVNLWRPTGEHFASYLHGGALQDKNQSAATGMDVTVAPDGQPTARLSDNKSDNKDNKSDNTALLALVRDDASITQSKMAASLGISRSTVALMLRDLQDEGIIRRVGSRKAGQWIVVDGDGA